MRIGLGSYAAWVTMMLSVLASGCSEDFWLGRKRYLSVEQTAGLISPRASEYSGRGFGLVQVDQLHELRSPSSLTYLGSDERFHYLRVWNKAGREGELQYVALRKPDCQVADATSIESEYAYRTKLAADRSWRHVAVSGNVCVVGPRGAGQ